MFVCVHARVCTRVPGLTRPSAPTLPSPSPSHERALSLSLGLHDHFPSLPECLMESGDGRKDERISNGEPAVTPLLPVPLVSFPIILEVDLAKCFLGGGTGTSFPLPFVPLGSMLLPPPIARPPLCCHWVPTVLPEPRAAHGLHHNRGNA